MTSFPDPIQPLVCLGIRIFHHSTCMYACVTDYPPDNYIPLYPHSHVQVLSMGVRLTSIPIVCSLHSFFPPLIPRFAHHLPLSFPSFRFLFPPPPSSLPFSLFPFLPSFLPLPPSSLLPSSFLPSPFLPSLSLPFSLPLSQLPLMSLHSPSLPSLLPPLKFAFVPQSPPMALSSPTPSPGSPLPPPPSSPLTQPHFRCQTITLSSQTLTFSPSPTTRTC